MSICAGCPLAPRALNDTLLRLVKSPLRRVPRTLLKKKAKRRRKQETTVINEKAGSKDRRAYVVLSAPSGGGIVTGHYRPAFSIGFRY